jgi:hypothetical protein
MTSCCHRDEGLLRHQAFVDNANLYAHQHRLQHRQFVCHVSSDSLDKQLARLPPGERRDFIEANTLRRDLSCSWEVAPAECEARAGKRRSARFDRRRAFSDRGQDERSYPVALDEFGQRRHSLGEPATSPWKGEWNYDVGRPLKGCPTRLNRFFRWNSGSRKFTSRF